MPRTSRAMSLSALVFDGHSHSSSSNASARTRSSTTKHDNKQKSSNSKSQAASTPVSPRASAAMALPLPIPTSFSTSSLALPSSGAEHQSQSQATQQGGKKSTNPLRSLLKKLRIDAADSLHSLAGAGGEGLSGNDSELDFGCSGLEELDDELRSLHEHVHVHDASTMTTTSLMGSRRPSMADGELHISLHNVHSRPPPVSSRPQSTSNSRDSQLQEHKRAALQHGLGSAGLSGKRNTNDSEQLSASYASIAAPTSPQSETQTLSPSTSTSSSYHVLSPFTCASPSTFTSISTSASARTSTSMSTSTSIRGSTASSNYRISSLGTTSATAATTSTPLCSSCVSSAFTSASPSESAATTDSARSSFSSQMSNTPASSPSIASSTCSPTLHSPPAAGFKHYTHCHAPASSTFVAASGKTQIHALELCNCDEKEGFAETEEQAALRRDQEEKAAIEALDAYFAVQTATAAAAATAHTTSSPLASIAPTISAPAAALAAASAMTNRARSQSVPRKMRRASSPALKAVSPYFAKYGDEPLPCLPSPFANHQDCQFQQQQAQQQQVQLQAFEMVPQEKPGALAEVAPCEVLPSVPVVAPGTAGEAASLPSLPRLRTRRSTTALRELNLGKRRPSFSPHLQQYMPSSSCQPASSEIAIEAVQYAILPAKPAPIHQIASIAPSTASPTAAAAAVTANQPAGSPSSSYLNFGSTPSSPTFKGALSNPPPRSASVAQLALLEAQAEAEIEEDEEDANGIAALDAYRFPARSNLVQGLPQSVKAPLGAATASRRGSLVASPSLPEFIRAQSSNANMNATGSSSVLVRSRAASLAATVNPAHRQAVYDFI